MVGVDWELKFHQVAESFVVLANHLAEVVGQAHAAVDVDAFAGAVVCVVDKCSKGEGLSCQV